MAKIAEQAERYDGKFCTWGCKSTPLSPAPPLFFSLLTTPCRDGLLYEGSGQGMSKHGGLAVLCIECPFC